MNATPTKNVARCCGTCKWLDVPAADLTKDLRTHKRRAHTMFFCRVPYTMPTFPESIRVEFNDDPKYRMMCPSYGTKCDYHVARGT